MNIAVIPARGGSKRIPHKNIKKFLGKPIIAYSIETAKNSGIFDRIIVSTDSEMIADVSRKYGAEVPFTRPKKLADDYTGTNAVIKHTIQWCLRNNLQPEYVCGIYATAPFLKKEYLEEGLRRLKESDNSFAFSVTPFPSPIFRALKINGAGQLEMFWPEYLTARSQDIPKSYLDAGQFYWGRAEAFLEDVVLFSPASIPVKIPSYLVQDIDTVEDWKRAELMFKVLQIQQAIPI